MTCDRPNIIVIVADALRPDHLSCYGCKRQTSPNLDRFARQCVLFDSAFAVSPSTVSSIPSILTGLYPSLHGTGVDGNIMTLNDAVRTMPDVLSQYGYTTVGFNTNPLVGAKSGYAGRFTSHFDVFPAATAKMVAMTVDYKVDGHISRDLLNFSQPYVCSRELNDQAAKWLAGDGREPFFMWIHYMDTHSPYLPRQPYFSDFASGKPGVEVLEFLRRLNQTYATLHKDCTLIPPRQRDLVMDCYDSEIAYLDRNFEDLVSLLNDYRLLDNTLIFVTADHGEEFWEHNQWGHSMRMYDINLHVPLLLKLPGSSAAGRTVSGQVRNIDIFPTLLDVLGVQPDFSLSGVSLLPCLDEQTAAAELPVVAEGGGVMNLSTKTLSDRLYAVRTPQWKFIKNTTRNEKQLYDLANDPMELNNVSARPEAGRVMAGLDSDIVNMLRTAAKNESNAPSEDFDAEITARLRALGYA